VLGYIFKPEPFTAHVMLITDRYAVVDGIVQRTRARGIVEGKSQKGCSLKYVERTEDVKEGDLVVTGGLDNIFPKGFPVAVVESVERKTFSVSLKVDLRPVVDPYKVEEVFVVVDAAKEDFGEKYAPVGATPTSGGTAAGSTVTTPSDVKPVVAPLEPSAAESHAKTPTEEKPHTVKPTAEKPRPAKTPAPVSTPVKTSPSDSTPATPDEEMTP